MGMKTKRKKRERRATKGISGSSFEDLIVKNWD